MENGQTINEFLEFYKTEMKPGKYWQLPKNKKGEQEALLYNENYYGAVKNDGEWGKLIIGDGYVQIQSRNISKKTGTYNDKTASLPHIVKAAKMIYQPGTVFLGEICFEDPKKTSKDVGSVMRCLPEKAIQRQEEEKLVFKVFDVLAMNAIATHTFKAENRKNIIINMPVGGGIMVTEFSNNPKKLLEKVFDRGGEGIMLMKKDEPYNFGNKKAWHSVKIKKELGELEAKVIETSQPNMIYDGTELKSWNYWQIKFKGETDVSYVNMNLHQYMTQGKQIIVDGKDVEHAMPVTKLYFNKWPAGVVIQHKGKRVTITSGLSDAEREYLAGDGKTDIENGDLVVVYSGMEETEDGSIRHPVVVRLRTDA